MAALIVNKFPVGGYASDDTDFLLPFSVKCISGAPRVSLRYKLKIHDSVSTVPKSIYSDASQAGIRLSVGTSVINSVELLGANESIVFKLTANFSFQTGTQLLVIGAHGDGTNTNVNHGYAFPMNSTISKGDVFYITFATDRITEMDQHYITTTIEDKAGNVLSASSAFTTQPGYMMNLFSFDTITKITS